jgi:DNA-binding Lrp family transcriptional regulator
MKAPFSKTGIAGRLAAALEDGLPLSPEPFGAVAGLLGVDQNFAVSVTEELLRSGFLRRFGAFWNFARFYSAYLFGAKAAPEKLGQISNWVNGHDSVTHSYLRDHWLNLWFTAIFQDGVSASLFLEGLRSQGVPFAALETVRQIKLCPKFAGRISGSGDASRNTSGSGSAPAMTPQKNKITRKLRETQTIIISALQERMTPQRRPFADIASRIGLGEAELLERLEELKALGILRKIGASVNHNAAGFTANSLMAFDMSGMPEDEAAGRAEKTVSGCQWASHCYIRRAVASNLEKPWRHGLFIMIHAKSGKELAEREALLAGSLAHGEPEKVISMRTLREYKKTSFNIDLR